jgi:tetratricopeptide (TPR) repeat protein
MRSHPAIDPRKTVFLVAAILLMTAAAFSSSLQNGFTHWDDDINLTANPSIQTLSWNQIRDYFTGDRWGIYKPLVLLTYSVEYHLFSLNPHVYHATNLVLHLFNCLIVFGLVKVLCGRPGTAALAATLFGVHPLQVEAVAWATGRKDLLAGFFVLGSLLFYLYYLERKKKKFYLLSLASFLLSFLAKPMGVAMPLALFFLDWYKKREFTGRSWIEKIPFFALAAIFTFATLQIHQISRDIRPLSHFSYQNIMTAGFGFFFYIGKSILPLRLSAYYPYPASGPWPIVFRCAPFFAVGVIAATYFLRNVSRAAFFGISFYLVMILPVLQIIQNTSAMAADRYAYVPILGIIYIVSYGFVFLSDRLRGATQRILQAALLFLIATLAVLTWQRCRVWHDDISLWSDVLQKYPNVAVAYNNRGNEYQRLGAWDKAMSDFDRAVAGSSPQAFMLSNRGNLFFAKGMLDRALADYSSAIAVNPGFAKAYFSRAGVFLRRGQYALAIDDYNRALRIQPDYAEAYNNRGNASESMKDYGAAFADYSRAISIKPDFAAAFSNRGTLYKRRGEYPHALRDYQKAVALDPQVPLFYSNLGSLYETMGQYDQAMQCYVQAISMDRQYAKVYCKMVVLYKKMGHLEEAQKAGENCLKYTFGQNAPSGRTSMPDRG